jgi:hypothetical protein
MIFSVRAAIVVRGVRAQGGEKQIPPPQPAQERDLRVGMTIFGGLREEVGRARQLPVRWA